jgi:type VI secretion system protein ImpC
MHEQHPLIRESWSALRELQASAYLGLAAPRFLLRMPYGKKTDPIDAFGFEEFTRQSGLSGMLWGHPGLIPALLLAEGFARQGLKMKLGTVMSVRDMPYYVYFDADGDQTALPCTERMYSERQAVGVAGYGVMPLLSLRGRPELRLGGFQSLAGPPLAGVWAPVAVTSAAAPARAAAADPVEDEAETFKAEPEETPADEAPSEDLDALMAGLEAPEPAAEAPAADEDLDALLASLNVEPPPPAADETETDLDALLASLS